MNNKLIVFFDDDTNEILFFEEKTTESEAVEFFKKNSLNKSKRIRKYFYRNDLQMSLIDGNSLKLKNGQLFYDAVEAVRFSKIRNIKEIRNNLIKNLDVPFMMALERGDDNLKNYVISLKNFLRDLPDNLRLGELETEEDVVRYNPFNNVFKVSVVDSGEGYEEPPVVTIDPPEDFFKGFQAKAIAFIDGGKIIRIEVTDKGCGYTKTPQVFISPPSSPSGKQAKAICFAIENAI